MKNLYIVGAGGMGRETLDLVLKIHAISGQRWIIKGFLDDTEDPLKDCSCDYGIVGSIKDFFPAKNDVLALAIADPYSKQMLVEMLKPRGAIFESIVYPYANTGRYCVFGEGVIIQEGFGITVNSKIGNFVTLLSCCIGHDVVIGDYSTISSHCNISGHVVIGERVFLGGNVAIAPRICVDSDAYLCMGSVILKDVPKNSKVLGNPARIIGLNVENNA